MKPAALRRMSSALSFVSALASVDFAIAPEARAWQPEKPVEIVVPTTPGGSADLIGPRGMTREQTAFWNDVLSRAVTTDTWKQALERNEWEANYLDSDGTRRLFDSDYAEYRSILTELGMIEER